MAIYYAVDNGASIINMSFGITPWINEQEKELREAFDYAYKHNVLIVNAAGNDGLDLDTAIANLAHAGQKVKGI